MKSIITIIKYIQKGQEVTREYQACVYCDNKGHRSADCTKVIAVDERNKILSEKRLCFNCTERKHRASECKSKRLCIICQSKHHTSICDQKKKLLVATGSNIPCCCHYSLFNFVTRTKYYISNKRKKNN